MAKKADTTDAGVPAPPGLKAQEPAKANPYADLNGRLGLVPGAGAAAIVGPFACDPIPADAGKVNVYCPYKTGRRRAGVAYPYGKSMKLLSEFSLEQLEALIRDEALRKQWL